MVRLTSKFWMACSNGNLEHVIYHLTKHPSQDINSLHPLSRKTALHVACEHGHADVVAYLLTLPQLDPNISFSPWCGTPLAMAFQGRCTNVVQILLQHGRINKWARALCSSVRTRDVNMVLLLLQCPRFKGLPQELGDALIDAYVDKQPLCIGALLVAGAGTVDLDRFERFTERATRLGRDPEHEEMDALVQQCRQNPSTFAQQMRIRLQWTTQAAKLLSIVIFWVDDFFTLQLA